MPPGLAWSFVDYDFQRLDLHDERDADRRSGWLQAVQRGFRAARPNDEFEKHWHQTARTDNHILTGAWLPPDAFGAGPVPVATLATFDKSINLGHELLPARLVTDVTTSPAHRRRGLAKRLMEDSLASARKVSASAASRCASPGRASTGRRATRSCARPVASIASRSSLARSTAAPCGCWSTRARASL